MIQTIRNFSKGLWLSSPPDATPDGYIRRARGMHPLSRGSFRSRSGSTLLHSLNAHSIFYFGDVWHYGVGTSVYRAAVEIIAGLNGNVLSFAAMPPTASVIDYLFCCGGGTLYKIDSSGNETNWGISPPADPTAALQAGGALTDGSTYKYQITYRNNTTGTRSNGNGTDVEATPAGANLTVRLTFAASGDAQVDKVEIWRSDADGTNLFLLDTVDDTDGTYDDDGSETLSTTQLPTDNLIPYSWFEQCLGPFNASMFWITRTEAGHRGQLYYSPVGRAEAVDGYINVTNDDDPLQSMFVWQSALGVFSEEGCFIIQGTNPYIARQIAGVPGTTAPPTVVTTPFGVVYEAADGIRIFNGTTSELLHPDGIGRIFRGESVENLSAMTGDTATYARDEYIISDGVQTLACNMREPRWRDLGIAADALFYSKEADILALVTSSTVLDFEDESSVTDNGSEITIDFATPSIRFSEEAEAIIRRILIDANTNNEQLTVYITVDNTETTLGTLQTPSRAVEELITEMTGRVSRIRIAGTTPQAVQIFATAYDFYIPKESQQ